MSMRDSADVIMRLPVDAVVRLQPGAAPPLPHSSSIIRLIVV
jgi:hypothetical protein